MRIIHFLFVLFQLTKQLQDNSDVLELTNNDFDATVWAHQYLLVYFYAPWCLHSQQFNPQYDKIALTLQKTNPEIVVAKLDCDGNRRVAATQKVNNFPAIKLFIDEKEHIYQGFKIIKIYQQIGEREYNLLINWVQKKATPQNTQLNNIDQLQKILTLKQTIFLLFLDEKKDKKILELYQNSINDYVEESKFYHTNDQQIRFKFNINNNVQLIAIKDQIIINFDQKFNQKNIEQFYINESGEWFMEWNQDSSDRIFAHLIPTLFLFEGQNQNLNNESLKIFETFQLKGLIFIKIFNNQGKLFICIVKNDDFSNDLREYLMIPVQDKPLIRILKPDSQDDPHQFVFNKEINLTNINIFVSDFLSNKIKRKIKSETQITQEGQIIKLTGNLFEEFVINTDLDVLVYFYANWCQNCQKFDQYYIKLSEFLVNQDNLLFTKIDSSLNDVDDLVINAYPTLYLYPKGRKQYPILFNEDERSLESIVEFLRKNIQNQWIDSKYDFNLDIQQFKQKQIENIQIKFEEQEEL